MSEVRPSELGKGGDFWRGPFHQRAAEAHVQRDEGLPHDSKSTQKRRKLASHDLIRPPRPTPELAAQHLLGQRGVSRCAL